MINKKIDIGESKSPKFPGFLSEISNQFHADNWEIIDYTDIDNFKDNVLLLVPQKDSQLGYRHKTTLSNEVVKRLRNKTEKHINTIHDFVNDNIIDNSQIHLFIPQEDKRIKVYTLSNTSVCNQLTEALGE